MNCIEITNDDSGKNYLNFKTKGFIKETDAPHSNNTLIEPNQSITNERLQKTMRKLFLQRSKTTNFDIGPKFDLTKIQTEFERICENSMKGLDTIRSKSKEKSREGELKISNGSSKHKKNLSNIEKEKSSIKEDCDIELISDSDSLNI